MVTVNGGRDEAHAVTPPVPEDGEHGEDGDGGHHHDPSGHGAEVSVHQVEDDVVGDGDSAAAAMPVDQVDEDPLPAEQTGQGHHEGGQADLDDQEPLERADGGGRHQPKDDGRPPGQVVRRRDEDGGDHRPDAGDEPNREIDLAENQHPDLGHAEEDEDRTLDEQVGDVAGREEDRVLDLEDHHQDDEPGDDGEDAALAVSDALGPGCGVLAEGRVGQRLRHRDAPEVPGIGRGGCVGVDVVGRFGGGGGLGCCRHRLTPPSRC